MYGRIVFNGKRGTSTTFLQSSASRSAYAMHCLTLTIAPLKLSYALDSACSAPLSRRYKEESLLLIEKEMSARTAALDQVCRLRF